jgi:hypothetical protein
MKEPSRWWREPTTRGSGHGGGLLDHQGGHVIQHQTPSVERAKAIVDEIVE